MKVAVIGGNGQLGMDLAAAFADCELVSLTHADIEVSDAGAVSRVLERVAPGLVVNTAAYHKVDDCEKNPDRAFQVNALGPLNLARASGPLQFDLVHISTDYVFDGEKKAPYLESDCPHPLNVYAASKVAGEHFAAAYSPRAYIVRSSGLYGHYPCRAKGGKNFIDVMLSLAAAGKEIRVVRDEVLTPTYTFDLARQIRELTSTGAYGLYHATNNGSCSWYEFAAEVFRIAGLNPDFGPRNASDTPTPIRRPSYSVLENGGLKALGIDHMPHWKESLSHYFKSAAAGNGGDR